MSLICLLSPVFPGGLADLVLHAKLGLKQDANHCHPNVVSTFSWWSARPGAACQAGLEVHGRHQ